MEDDGVCEQHHSKFAGKAHPDFGHKQKGYGDVLGDHKRGAGHPAKHTKGKLRSQLQPDHGPHK